jgi:hypothetical protein
MKTTYFLAICLLCLGVSLPTLHAQSVTDLSTKGFTSSDMDEFFGPLAFKGDSQAIAAPVLLSDFPAGVSRACRFSDIPGALQKAASMMLYFVGGSAASPKLLTIANDSDKPQWWTLESITVDIGNRYFLYAESTPYGKVNASPDSSTVLANTWKSGSMTKISEAAANSRTAEELQAAIKKNNRNAFSVRAGNPSMIENTGRNYHQVIGRHAYFVPRAGTGAWRFLSNTTATDCNLGNWGWISI